MATTLFERNIQHLNFSLLSETEEGGVLLIKGFDKLKKRIVTPEILFGLEKAKKFNADAVYFRYIPERGTLLPQLYFFDFTNKQPTPEEKNDIHIRMWNGYQVPAYVIIEKTVINFFDSREKPERDKDNYAKEIITLTGNAIKAFDPQRFDDGSFWEEQGENKHFQFEQSATRDLIRGLKAVYKDFQAKSNLDKHVALKLLVQSLLIKYLEERDEDSESGYFAGTYFRRNFQCNNFCETIRNGKLLDLLDKLASDFNGKIFEWNINTEQKARAAIQKTAVTQLADYLDGNIQDSQYVIWRLYSFSHLPVEVISSVYEELLTNSKDIVYTPEMIVNVLVDECMPINKPQKDFKLIDVSCGSGIFLVKAYKRIVQWWRYDQWLKSGDLVKPSLSVLKELLLKSIHGIDIQQDAIRLSVFSLALAILDEVNLDPPTWGKLKFPDLNENIITQDFFKYITVANNEVFDLVIGNPPFNLQPINGKEPNRKEYFERLKKQVGYKSEVSIPDENPALHFLVQSLKLIKSRGLLCLIQPSGPLFYQKDLTLKQNLFAQYNLLQVIDFTKLSDKLWGKKTVATAAIFLQKLNPDAKAVLHLVANKNFSNSSRLFLEFDHYDFYYIDKLDVLNNPYVWKSNLMGGGRLTQLIERLSELRTLGDFMNDKIKSRGWKYCEGYTVGNRKHKADFIHNKVSIKPESFNEQGIIRTDIETESHFEAPRLASREIYLKPHILIKENIGNQAIPMAFVNYDAVFSHEIIGIYAPHKDLEELKKLFEILKQSNRLYQFFILATSSRLLIGRATAILKRDIDNLPLPEKLDSLKTSVAENIIIDEILHYRSKESAQLLMKSASIDQIKEFSKIFCQTLNSIYRTNERSFQLLKIIDTPRYYALHFEYSTENLQVEIELNNNLENYLSKIIPSPIHHEQKVNIQKIFKAYGQNTILLSKPKTLRYWTLSIALRDADESFSDYIKARYYNA